MADMKKLVPSPVERMEKLGSYLHDLRIARGLSLRSLAKRAGCSPSFLSQVELGRSSPSLESLERISRAFDLTVVELLNLVQERSEVVVGRGAAQGQTVSVWQGATLSHLLPFHVPAAISVLVLDLQPNGQTAIRVARRAMKELGVVVKGAVECEVDEAVYSLKTGESIYFDLITPHRWRNPGAKPARVLLVNPNFTEVVNLPSKREAASRP